MSVSGCSEEELSAVVVTDKREGMMDKTFRSENDDDGKNNDIARINGTR